jgi:hypothetical protein
MKQWIEENWNNIVFGIELFTFSTFLLTFIFGGMIIGACLAG